MFFQKGACPQSLFPLGHSDGFASVQPWSFVVGASCTDFVQPLVSIHAQSLACPYFGILAENPFPCERLCMLGWLCIVQSLWAYTPGVRAGAECGAAALTPLGATPQTPFLITIEFFQQKSNPPSTVNSVTADNLILKRIFRLYSVKIQCPAVYLICSVIEQVFYLRTAVSLVQVEIRHCCGKASIGNIGNDAGCSIPYILSV